MRIVIDTNALIAALTKPRGSAARVLRLWREGRLEIVSSEATLKEAELVLNGAWLSRVTSRDEVRQLLAEMRGRSVLVRPPRIRDLRLKDAGDLRLVEAAVAGDASYLVTADREVLLQRGYGATEFVTPGELLEIVRNESGGSEMG